MRVAAAVVFALAGCGRVGFDESGMVIEQTATSVTLTAPERFRLVFDRDFEWQPVRWYDLASDPVRDLIDKVQTNASHNLMQGVLVRWANEWQTATEGLNATIAVERVGVDHVRLTTAWSWVTASRQLAVSIVHTIGGDGTWQLDATISDPTGDPAPVELIEYADAHLTQGLAWDIAEVTGGYEFVAIGVTPPPALRVTRTSGLGTVRSDELNNRYWVVGNVAMPVELTWTVTLGHP